MRQSWWSGGKGESGSPLGRTPGPGRMPAGGNREIPSPCSIGQWGIVEGNSWRTSWQLEKCRPENIRLEEDGQTSFFEARAVACQPRGMLVLLRNTTPLRDAEDGLNRATEKSDHLDETLEAESFIRAEEEKIIKSSFEKLADLKEDTINAVTSIVRKKDPDTARHQERVSHLACAIGQEMGLDKDTVSIVALASLLHDLGKVFRVFEHAPQAWPPYPCRNGGSQEACRYRIRDIEGDRVPQPDGGDNTSAP